MNGRCVKVTRENHARRRCARPIRLRISYGLDVPAGVTITIARLLPGRLVKGRCAKATDKDHRRPRCTRVIRVRGVLSVKAGSDSLIFRGRLHGHRIKPGSYRLTATPAADGMAGLPRTTRFTIAGAARG